MMRIWTMAAPYSRKVMMAVAVLAMAACAEDINVNTAPTLEFVSMSRTTVRSADEPGAPANSVVFTFNFSDGDGDLGDGGEPGTGIGLRIVDKRVGYPYQLPELNSRTGLIDTVTIDSVQRNSNRFEALIDSRNPITGTLTLTINDIEFTPPRNAINANPPPFPRPTQQELQFNIQLIDRAGNRSAPVLTPPILITN